MLTTNKGVIFEFICYKSLTSQKPRGQFNWVRCCWQGDCIREVLPATASICRTPSGSSRDFVFLKSFSWIHCISLLFPVHTFSKRWQTTCVKHFKRDLFISTEALDIELHASVCLKLRLWFITTLICGIISAMKRNNMAQIEDKRKEKKKAWKVIHIHSLAQTLTHIIMQTITVHSGLQISLVLSLQTDLC